MNRINQDIADGKFNNVYLLYGEENYLRNQYRDKLVNALAGEGDTLNTSHYAGKGINIGEVIDLAETMPFLSERRVIVIEDSGLFQTTDGEQLAEYINQMPDTTYLIFSEESINKTYKLFKRVKAKGYCTELGRLSNADMRKWIMKIIRDEKRSITPNAFEEFILRCGNDMYMVKSELEKVLAYTYGRNSIDVGDVRAVCTVQLEDKIFDMLDNIMLGRTNDALSLYGDLIALQVEPEHILSMIIRQLRLMMHTKVMNREGKSVDTIKDTLGVQEFVVRKLINQTRNVLRKSIEKAIIMCVQTEEDARRGKIDIKIGVELIIISLAEGGLRAS